MRYTKTWIKLLIIQKHLTTTYYQQNKATKHKNKQNLTRSLNTDSGKKRASLKSRLNDLSFAGKASSKHLAFNKKYNTNQTKKQAKNLKH